MEDQMMEALMAKLAQKKGISPEDMAMKLSSLSDSDQMKMIRDEFTTGPSAINMFDMVKLMVDAKPNVPLGKIRDDDHGPPFDNFVCMGCGKGIDSLPHIKTFSQCSRCKAVKYCSRQCQSQDWIGNGNGPSKPRKHKDLCPELIEANVEYTNHATAGPFLRTELFSSWANQHHENGSFFLHEFLSRKDLLGGSEVGFWAKPNVMSPYHSSGKDVTGFQNGQMLLGASFPSLREGWTKSLRDDECPSSSPPVTAMTGLKGWKDYMTFRGLSCTSVAPLLLTNVLTVYQMLFHELKLTQKRLRVYILGVETELNQIPLFQELLYLLPPGVHLELVMVSPAAKAISHEARGRRKTSLLAQDHVLDVRHGESRLQVTIDGKHEFFHDVPNIPSPDAVLALNAGLGSYHTWHNTMHKIIRLEIPFCWSDQTIVTMRNFEKVYLCSRLKEMSQHFSEHPPLCAPRLDIKLNPFHGIVGRDVAAVLAPNIDNGYLSSFAY
jgi:hypothetical protein